MADVLVVDPGELGELLVALLGQYGMEAAHTRSGEEALERALMDKPRVAIVEHELPDAPGVDVAELLRSELGTKVILTYPQSLMAEQDEPLLSRLATMDASFARPFRSLTLVEGAARLLGKELQPRAGAAGEAPHALSSTDGVALDDDDDDIGQALAEDQGTQPSHTLPNAALRVDSASDELLLDVEVVPQHVLAGVDSSEDPIDAGFAAILVSGEAPAPDAIGPAPPLQQRIAERAFSPGGLGDLWRRVQARRGAAPHAKAPDAPSATPFTPRTLADMLDAFHQSQTTGELWLSHERSKRVLLLRRGVVVGARSNIEAEDLSTLAGRRGALLPDDVRAVRRDVLDAKRRTIVDAILARGLLAEAPLRALVEENVRRVALGAFRWQTGEMRVTLEGRAVRETMPVRVSVGDLIVRGILLTEGDDALLAAAPDDARFSPAADSSYGLEDLRLGADEARAVIAMDGTKTIKDLVTLFDPTPSARTIRGLAAGLLCLNLVRFAGWGPAEARRISFF